MTSMHTCFQPGDICRVFDIVGTGFGPSNIAIAIAQQEIAPELSALFLERRDSFGWHEAMMFDGATMQVNFLKDLATFRNPRSRFTFVNFLHAQKRLSNFGNLQTLFPRRIEFRQYLEWSAAHFEDRVCYGTTATRIEAGTFDGERVYRVTMDGPNGPVSVFARAIAFCGGLEPRIPFPVVGDGRVSHGYTVLNDIDGHAPSSHYAVIGSGQSAAEITEFLFRRGARVTALASRFGYMPADDSPFVNQIFDPEQVDVLFATSDDMRAKIFEMHASTNYSGVDLDLLKSLYAAWYHDQISGECRFNFRRMIRVVSAVHNDNKVVLALEDGLKNSAASLEVDYVICATGFTPRSVLDLFPDDLRAQVRRNAAGSPIFDRSYALAMLDDGAPPVYAPHMSERQHGLTATLLSNMAIRSGEIVENFLSRKSRAGLPKIDCDVTDAS